ncbi:GNAT family N-acetyltransferase [Morganella morganii]|uniref:GNAT family N-acetyltransferase n=1 Tax=Morganella morganii TaxID=582 RepID=UPI001EDCE966|nr:GNAT family N-acetyltransferase [Morganella morganii]
MRVTFSPSEAEISVVQNGLRSHNTAFFDESEHTGLAVFHEVNGEIKAGLTGDIIGNWLRIKYLWVDKSLRGQRIGTALMRQAQESARERGAKFAQVDTFSFQARPFYLKMGFEEVLTLESYPRTHERIYFRKTLEQP